MLNQILLVLLVDVGVDILVVQVHFFLVDQIIKHLFIGLMGDNLAHQVKLRSY